MTIIKEYHQSVNSLDKYRFEPGQDQCIVGSGFGPNCIQRLLASMWLQVYLFASAACWYICTCNLVPGHALTDGNCIQIEQPCVC